MTLNGATVFCFCLLLSLHWNNLGSMYYVMLYNFIRMEWSKHTVHVMLFNAFTVSIKPQHSHLFYLPYMEARLNISRLICIAIWTILSNCAIRMREKGRQFADSILTHPNSHLAPSSNVTGIFRNQFHGMESLRFHHAWTLKTSRNLSYIFVQESQRIIWNPSTSIPICISDVVCLTQEQLPSNGHHIKPNPEGGKIDTWFFIFSSSSSILPL